MSPPKPRFIAGAVCPSCREMDRLVIESAAEDPVQRRRCVACGFSDETTAAASSPPKGRLIRSPAEDAVSPVRLIDPRRLPDD